MKIAITPPPEKSDIPLALRTEKCNNILALLLLVRDASVMGFMSGGMVADTASEGFCNYLYNIRNIHRVFKVVAILQLSFKPPEIILSLVKMARIPKPFNAPIVNNLPDGPS